MKFSTIYTLSDVAPYCAHLNLITIPLDTYEKGSLQWNMAIKIGYRRVAHFDYSYIVIDNDVYNLTFVTDLPNAELLGWFICPAEFQEKWEQFNQFELLRKGYNHGC